MEESVAHTSRKALYDEVWESPLTTLANKYRMSNVGLAKICRKHEIPNPPRGYWAKLKHGQKKRRTPLPRPDYDPEISIHAQDQTIKSRVTYRCPRPPGLEKPVPVPSNLRGAHPLVLATLHELDKVSFWDKGLSSFPRHSLHIRVSKESMKRALRLMAGLIKALESHEYPVSISDKTGRTVAIIKGQQVGFRIDEHLKITKTERPISERYGTEGYWPKHRYDYHPSGKLVIHISSVLSCWHSFRERWADGEKKRLETQLASILSGMIDCADTQIQQVADNELAEKKRHEDFLREEEERKAREELKDRIQEEQERVDDLLEQAEDWVKSRHLREYLATYKAKAESKGESCAPDSELGKWLKWAFEQADRIDPLTKSPASILDRSDELSET